MPGTVMYRASETDPRSAATEMCPAYRDKTAMRVHASELFHTCSLFLKEASVWEKKKCHFGKVQQFTQYSEDRAVERMLDVEESAPQNLITSSALT